MQVGPGDNTGPVLLNVTVATAVVNTGTAAVTVAVLIRYQTSISGLSSCSAYFLPPNNIGNYLYLYGYVSNNDIVSGSLTDGTMRVHGTLSQLSPQGVWNMMYVECSDAYGRVTAASAPFSGYSFNVSFVQLAPGYSLSPNITSLAFGPLSVNTQAQQVLISGLLGFSDGVGISSCSVSFSPDGNNYFSITGSATTLSSGNATQGVMALSGTLSTYSIRGYWTVRSVTCQNIASHQTNIDTASQTQAFLALSAPQGFNQTGLGDRIPPVIRSFQLYPTTLNTTAQDVLVYVRLDASDNMSGINYCEARFNDPDGVWQAFYIYGYVSNGYLVSGTILNGTMLINAYMRRWARMGVWPLQSVSCIDNAGNWGILQANQVQAQFNLSLAQISINVRFFSIIFSCK